MNQTKQADKAKVECIKDILYLLERMGMKDVSRVLWYASKL